MKKYLKSLNPIWFYKESMKYMGGYSKLYIWIRMPRAYARIVYFTLKDLINEVVFVLKNLPKEAN